MLCNELSHIVQISLQSKTRVGKERTINASPNRWICFGAVIQWADHGQISSGPFLRYWRETLIRISAYRAGHSFGVKGSVNKRTQVAAASFFSIALEDVVFFWLFTFAQRLR
jgi:hypothetical protein